MFEGLEESGVSVCFTSCLHSGPVWVRGHTHFGVPEAVEHTPILLQSGTPGELLQSAEEQAAPNHLAWH